MVIDIVDLTSDQYKNLSPVQLAMVRAAQVKKDKIVAEAEKISPEKAFERISERIFRLNPDADNKRIKKFILG